jgi:hypothetical protein
LVEICSPALAAVLVEVAVAVLGVLAAGVDALGVDAEELVLLEELPQPASASRPTARVTAESVDIERGFARRCARKLTSQILHRLGSSVVRTPPAADPSRAARQLYPV